MEPLKIAFTLEINAFYVSRKVVTKSFVFSSFTV